ncbi:GNAT family N-acetyltransferase [Streptomyces achromogenes]|uniref:GNAT family N-acetyltransferase n=1 Tax=Streptomyces achromogenes TaxID=67255 RepID=UPI0027D7E51A|nr:GNAT family N-acetyltransferase [Streptomyces achromogenes]
MPATRPSLRVRTALEQDMSDIVLLDREVFPDLPYPYFVLRQLLDAFKEHMFVVHDGDRLCGYVLATPPSEGQSWILTLGVAPGMRHRGLGRQLMREALDRLRAEGARTARLGVRPENVTAIRLYISLGFAPDPGGPRSDYFGPGEDRLLMTLAL